jgi:hypothetical protein
MIATRPPSGEQHDPATVSTRLTNTHVRAGRGPVAMDLRCSEDRYRQPATQHHPVRRRPCWRLPLPASVVHRSRRDRCLRLFDRSVESGRFRPSWNAARHRRHTPPCSTASLLSPRGTGPLVAPSASDAVHGHTTLREHVSKYDPSSFQDMRGLPRSNPRTILPAAEGPSTRSRGAGCLLRARDHTTNHPSYAPYTGARTARCASTGAPTPGGRA